MAEVSLIESKRSVESNPPEPESVLFNRRIDFHLARKPFSGIGNRSSNGFKLVTLNPNSWSLQDSGSGKKGEKSENSESGFDPELGLEITFRKIGAGLRNLGNTCFLNSVLQCLTYTEPLAAYLQSGKHQNSCRTSGFCALCAIQKHVSRALQSTGRILEPKDLVSNLRCISRNFRSARQEDAHEYMVNLLESMHRCCLPSGVPTESPSAYEKSLVHKIFGGRLQSQVKCMQCSFSSNKFDPFLDLSLEIVKADSLQKALSHFTAKELLDGGAKQYQCQQCKQKVKALKQLTINKAPHILAVHLKRFGSHVNGQKIDRKVAFGPTLDLKPFVTGPYEGDLNYTLYGVLVHAGYSTHSGHYYCFVRTSSGMWHSLDDNQVVQVSEKKVLEQKAYMLFYFRDRRNFVRKNPVDILHKENMVMNAIGKSVHPMPNGSAVRTPEASLFSALSERNGSIATPPKQTPPEKTYLQNGNGSCLTGKSSGDVLTAAKIADCNGSQSIVPGQNLSTATVFSDPYIPRDHSINKKETDNFGILPSTSSEGGNKETANSSNQNNHQNKLVGVQISNLSVAAKNKLKVRRKTMKIRAATMLLSTRIIFGDAVSLKKKKQKTRKRRTKTKTPDHPKHPLGGNDLSSSTGLSDSDKSVPLSINHSNASSKKVKSGSEDKCKRSNHCNGSVSSDVISNEVGERVVPDSVMLAAAENKTQTSRSTVQGPGNSGEQGTRKMDVMSMLSRGLEDTTVARWDGINASISEKIGTSIVGGAGTTAQIGHIGDEWDEEYDRGKRKKIRLSKMEFGGPNLFQEIASKRKRGNAPFRI